MRVSNIVFVFGIIICLFITITFADPYVNIDIHTETSTILSLADGQGACNNSNDLLVFNHTWTTFHATLQKCAKDCWGAGNCSADCLAKAINLSKKCAYCFGGDVDCSSQNCIKQCMFNPESPDCIDCSNKFCKPGLLACAGLDDGQLPS